MTKKQRNENFVLKMIRVGQQKNEKQIVILDNKVKEGFLEVVPIPSRNFAPSKFGHKQKTAMLSQINDHAKKDSVMERAEEVGAYLGKKFPTCIKFILPSHVSGGFWLGLPRKFCRSHLPNHDAMVILVDESGKEYPAVYLAESTGLSGGWRRFSIEHGLLEQDALVFQLVEPDKLKIYIVRANWLSETDGALGLMHLSHAKQIDFDGHHEKMFLESLPPTIHQ